MADRLGPYQTRKLEAGIKEKIAAEDAAKTKARREKFARIGRGVEAIYKAPPKKSKARAPAGSPALRRTISKFTGGSVPGAKGGRVKQGRGRPHGSYDARFLPGVGMVKMPIQAYKRALSAAKAKIRFKEELQKAEFQKAQRLASPTAPDHLGRGMPGEFQFAEEPDEMPMGGMPVGGYPEEVVPQGPGMLQRAQSWLAQRRMGQAGAGYGQPGVFGGGPGMYGQQGSLMQPSRHQLTLMQGTPAGPKMNIWGGPNEGVANALHSPYAFDESGKKVIGF